MRRVLMVVLALAVPLAGCGSDDSAPQSAEDQIRELWAATAQDAASGEGAKLCARVTAEGKRLITERSSLPCEDTVKLLTSPLTDAQREEIRGTQPTKITVTGDSAVVTFEPTAALTAIGFTGSVELQKVAGQWLLSGL